MLPDQVSNPGPLTYESGALPIALCSPAGRPVIIIDTHMFPVYITKSYTTNY